MVFIEELVKKYGKHKAVDGLTLNIDEGHIYGLVGPNGAGKTTTFKIIAGLLKSTSGRVIVNGIEINNDPEVIRSKIGYMPDFFGVYDDLKVSEYMDFYAGAYKVSKGGSKRAIDELLELVDLKDRQDFYVDALSRGMKQRLCLARSLIHNPDLLVLDEPASGLDPRARIEMKEILKTLRGMGKTILISSHILPELSELCTAIGIIENGRMIVSGTVEEIMKKFSQNRTVRIKVTGEPDSAVKLLKEQPSISSVNVRDEIISADFDGDENTLRDLLKNIILSGVPVISFAETENSLESIFLNVTGGAVSNEN